MSPSEFLLYGVITMAINIGGRGAGGLQPPQLCKYSFYLGKCLVRQYG